MLKNYLKISKFYIVMITLLRSLQSVALTLIPIYVGWVLDNGILVLNNNVTFDYKVYIAYGLTILLVIAISSLLSLRMEVLYIKKIRIHLESDVFDGIIMGNTTLELDRNILINEIDLIIENYFKCILIWPTLLIPLCIGLYYTLSVSYISVIAMVVGLAIVLLINQIMVKPFSKSVDALQKSKTKINKIIVGFLNAMTTIKVFMKEDYAKESISKKLDEKKDIEYKCNKISVQIESINNFFSIIIQLVPIIVLAIMISLNKITVGESLAIVLLFEKIVAPIEGIGNLKSRIGSVKNIKVKIEDILEKRNNVSKERKIINTKDLCVKFDNVSYKYEDNYVFKNLSFNIGSNEKCLIKGDSGSGKSTILKILTKQIENYEGEIYLGDTDLRDISKEELNDIIAIIPQNPEMITGSIINNITFENKENVDYDRLNYSLEKVSLDISDEKLNESIYEENICSGGEYQRIALARAFYNKNKKILLLDEITSSLDKETAKSIENTVVNIEDKTILSVLHITQDQLKDKYSKSVTL